MVQSGDTNAAEPCAHGHRGDGEGDVLLALVAVDRDHDLRRAAEAQLRARRAVGQLLLLEVDCRVEHLVPSALSPLPYYGGPVRCIKRGNGLLREGTGLREADRRAEHRGPDAAAREGGEGGGVWSLD